MELVDCDGDRLQFFINKAGVIREYVNGKLSIERVTKLEYSKAAGTVRDDTGVFKLKPDDQIAKALGLRALAAQAGVAWCGDEPTPATQLVLTDTDGDKLEFSLTDMGKLQESNNGKVEIAEIQQLRFDLSAGTIEDDTGVFKLPASECIEKASVLRSLASEAGVKWCGDDPNISTLATPQAVLDIENCAADWEYQCPKRWESLSVTARPNERFCDSCKEIVYFCNTEEELAAHVDQRRCVAFDLRADPAPKDLTTETVAVQVVLLSGQELPIVHMLPSQTVAFLKVALTEVSGIPTEQQRLLLDEHELVDEQSVQAAGVTSDAILHLARVEPEPPTPAKPPRRVMGRKKRCFF